MSSTAATPTNLGLRSIKRTLLQLEVSGELARYDRVLVLLVDAFTTPTGADRDRPDPRSILSLLLDTNVSTGRRRPAPEEPGVPAP